jgi:hypothetical protein
MTLDDGHRPPPPRPYQPNNLILTIPVDAVEALLAMLQAAGAQESGLFLYGRRSAVGGVVMSVRAPKQFMSRYNYEVSAAAMSEMCVGLADELNLLAQVHSHPGVGVEHSPYDDQVVASRRALSLVVPHYGRPCHWPADIGVHEWQDGYWYLLEAREAARRVQLAPRAAVERMDFR